MSRAARAAAVVLATFGLSGCYFSNPPSAPHGHTPMQVEQLAPLTVSPAPAQLASQRVIVLARFDAATVQPIGGLYDLHDYETSPLLRTYFFKHGPLELFEHACDALRATGLDVRKDYATTGEPALLEAQLRALQPLIVRTRILSLQHDQVRTEGEPPSDNEVLRLVAEVSVVDPRGGTLYQGRHEVTGRLLWQQDSDVLRLLGLAFGERLSRDPAFVSALGARVRGAS